MKQYEIDLLNKYDAIVPITSVDQKIFESYGCKIPIKTFPLGVDVNEYPYEEKMPEEFSAFFAEILGDTDLTQNVSSQLEPGDISHA